MAVLDAPVSLIMFVPGKAIPLEIDSFSSHGGAAIIRRQGTSGFIRLSLSIHSSRKRSAIASFSVGTRRQIDQRTPLWISQPMEQTGLGGIIN
ncbi:hypothetical protein [Planctomycetes bacterium SV_7m_r]|uniref:hypothetical protein n=1 Tax=Stieleria bergensis TaxID=2528025 RepID=UPI0011A3F065